MKVILSCTTTYERREVFYYCLQSLLRQSYIPDKFLINISKESYLRDSGFSELPEWMNDDRVTINWVENTGSYRKLLPALEYTDEDDLIVTADDDILYSNNWLRDLLSIHADNPKSIVCTRARLMSRNPFDRWKNYNSWPLIEEKEKGNNILPTGGAGAVYQKELLDLDFLVDREFRNIAPTTDDLWFRAASLIKDTPVFVKPAINSNNNFILHENGLEEINFKKKKNSFFVRPFRRVQLKLYNYIGINCTKNDESWDKIRKYVEQKYNKKLI